MAPSITTRETTRSARRPSAAREIDRGRDRAIAQVNLKISPAPSLSIQNNWTGPMANMPPER
jgi:hypothetical protein